MGQVVLIIQQIMAISPIMPIPRRQIQPHIDAVGSGGGDKLLNDVSSAVLPRAADDRVGGVFGRPEAEAVVVLGGENHEGNSGGGGSGGPLGGVERSGIEEGGGLSASAPFGVGESVGSKVEEHDDFSLLPFQLGEGREWEDWQWRRC